jgi:CMP-N,N'-diacetyllegionaminic acid synthase
MKILAVIPARAGSKRLPNKNKLPLGGKPLIVWSIEAAQGISEICDILVSTNDPEIAEIAKEAGAFVPWLRPTELATDTASSVDVVLHAINWYEQNKNTVDGVLLLQPTSPFRTKEIIVNGIEQYINSNKKNIIGVSPAHHHPSWMLKINENNLLEKIIEDNVFNTRSQDLPPAFSINGSFYLTSPANIRKSKSFFDEETLPLITNNALESLDIDTENDLIVAKCIVKNYVI